MPLGLLVLTGEDARTARPAPLALPGLPVLLAPRGPKGDAGFSGLITVAGGTASGDKQFTVNCPLNDVDA